MSDQGECRITVKEFMDNDQLWLHVLMKERGVPMLEGYGQFDPSYLVEQLRCNDTGDTIYRWRKL